MGKHLVPFRTQKLSPFAPMILFMGKVGRRQFEGWEINTPRPVRRDDPPQIWGVFKKLQEVCYNHYMQWSLRRQALYFFAVFIVVAGIVVFIVWKLFFSSVPTCFDGKQNGIEVGVDCGGTCQLACEQESKPLIIRWAQVTPVTDNVYNAVAYIENQNLLYAVKNIHYSFLIYDEKNILITERNGSTFIGSNQRTAIFEPSIKVGNRMPAFTHFSFTEEPIFTRVDKRLSQRLLTVERQTWSQLESSPKLKITLRNSNTFDISDIRVISIAYDGQGNALVASATVIDEIPQGSFVDSVFTWPKPLSEQPVRTEIIPRINPFTQSW